MWTWETHGVGAPHHGGSASWTPNFSTGHDLAVLEFKPRIGLSAVRTDIRILCPPFSTLPSLSLSLSKYINLKTPWKPQEMVRVWKWICDATIWKGKVLRRLLEVCIKDPELWIIPSCPRGSLCIKCQCTCLTGEDSFHLNRKVI